MSQRRDLDRAAVVAAAAAISDADGFDTLTLAAVAQRLGIRTPSLYNHVSSLADLRSAVAIAGRHALAATMGTAAQGRSADDAVRAIAQAFRAFAKDHPGLYAAMYRVPDGDDPERRAAAWEIIQVVLNVLTAYGLEGDAAIHTVRVIQSMVYGFVALEVGGAFGMPLDIDESFDLLLTLMLRGLRPS